MQHANQYSSLTVQPSPETANVDNPSIGDPGCGIDLFGLEICNAYRPAVLDWISRRIQLGHKAIVNFANAHCINVSYRDETYFRVLQQSTLVLPDGSGIRLAMKLHGIDLRENLNGTDLFPELCKLAAREGFSIYLFGAAPGVAAQVESNMTKKIPGLKIAGTHHGYFDEDRVETVIDEINRSGADILLVAMGIPTQEKWLAKHAHRLNTTINMGVGGLFDFYAERISRAPLWLRKMGMEWTWRLLQEPVRMWRRYILGNPEFVLRSLIEVRRLKRQQQFQPQFGQHDRKSWLRRLQWWLQAGFGVRAKRTIDIIGALSGLLLLSPLLLLTMLAVRLDSEGPVFFSQQRVGYRGETFRFWKFRSMYVDAEQRWSDFSRHNEMPGGVLFKIKNDPRVTRVGRVIRRFSIDELPQLWNVLRGDMSLVGPRPALPGETEQYSLSDRERLNATPGITCDWQVSGRSELPFERQVEMDKHYIQQASVWLDIKLILKTIPAVIQGRGAY